VAQDLIMIVTNSVSGGGAERAMNLLANELHNKNIPVLLVALNESGSDFVEIKSPLLNLGREKSDGLIRFVYTYFRYLASVHAKKPSLIVTNCDLPEFFTCLLPINVKILVVEHCNPSWSTRKFLGHIVRRILRLRSATFVAVSSHFSIWPFESSPSSILPNMLIPLNRISTIDIGTKIERLVFVGRLAKIQKRPHVLLDIAKKLRVPLLFIGEGEERGYLEKRSKSESIDATFLDFQIDPWGKIRQGDLLVVPSAFEGDGLVVLEAIQRDVPLLLADIPDFRRFGLPSYNYCDSVDDYCDRITQFSSNLRNLVVSNSIKMELVSERSAEKVLAKFLQISRDVK